MLIYNFLEDIKAPTPTAVALGFFDALHLGHKEVLSKVIGSELLPAVFTFSAKNGKNGKETILCEEEKRNILKEMGIKLYFSPDFDSFKAMDGDEFVSTVLKKALNARLVVCGEDFRFGKDRKWSVKELFRLCEQNGMELIVVPLKKEGGEKISTTKIRELLEKGDVSSAQRLIGRQI